MSGNEFPIYQKLLQVKGHNLNNIRVYHCLQFYRLLKKIMWCKYLTYKMWKPCSDTFSFMLPKSCWRFLLFNQKVWDQEVPELLLLFLESFEIMGNSKIMTMKDHSQPEFDSHSSDVFIPNSDVFSRWYCLKCMQPFHKTSHALNGMWCLGSYIWNF